MRKAILGALAAALAAAAAVPGAAHAAPPTQIGFDDLPAGTQVVDQYLQREGVQFGHPYRFGISTPLGDPDSIPAECRGANDTGSLTVDANGITGRSGAFVCGGENSTTNVIALHYTTERRGTAFTLRSRSGRNGDARVRLYGVGRRLLEERTVALPAGQSQRVSFTRAGPDVVTVVVTAGGPAYSGAVELDDLTAPVDDTPPPAKFELGRPLPLEVAEGGTARSTVPVLRYNGSTGPVTLSVPALPEGIAAVQAEPNPVTGLDPAKLAVTARGPAAPGRRTLTVNASGSASAGTFVGGSVSQEVNVVSALQAHDTQAGVVSGCGGGEARATVTARGGYRGRVTVAVRKVSGPVEVLDSSASFLATGDGSYPVAIRLRQPARTGGQSVVEVTFRPENATPVTAHVKVFDSHVVLGNVTRTSPRLPENFPGRDTPGMGNGGEEIRVAGRFPVGCVPEFEDDHGRRLAVVKIEDGGPDGIGVARLRLPRDPVSTRVTAYGPDKVLLDRSTNAVQLVGFRNGPALAQANSGAGAGAPDYSWSQFLETFGSDDADICLGLGCVRDPIAIAHWEKYRDDVRSMGGLCFGYSTMALRLDRRLDALSSFSRTARRGWEITPFTDDTAIKRAVVRWQVSQNDKNWRAYRESLMKDKSPAEFRSELLELLRKQDAVAIRLRSGGSGHAVVAYDLRDRADGGYDILTYNPNNPYTTGEETNRTTLDTAVRESTITVSRTGTWSGGIWSAGTPWTGNMASIAAYDRLPPGDAELPLNLSIASLLDLSAAPAGDPARIGSIRTGGVEALRPDGTVKPGTGVRAEVVEAGAAGDDIEYVLAPGRAYDLAVAGRPGPYSQTLLSGSVATTVRSSRPAAGRRDVITLAPGEAQVGLRGGAGSAVPATLELAARAGGGGKATRTASVQLPAGRGAADTLSFSDDRRTLSLRHTGPAASVAVTLGATGHGLPAGVTTAPIRVAGGQRLELRPADWRDPAGGVRLTVRDSRGRVVRSGAAPLRPSAKVAFAGALAAKAKPARSGKRTVTVSGRVARPGAAPLLAVTVEAVRRGKVVRKATVLRRGVGAGAFSVPVALRGVPRGATLRATAILVDEASSMATARRSATVR